ncbi:hypothetical protein T265_10647 [Opisthorchis viverrini]|uniref:Uncharacterized protein n=1 Tax=Opisthorchis viverrini TaxID=6198 RepID=A0A074Z5T8_OPIVI|nr:hypothetical protein T265_10646 [Opisthorchis viverrini]XP_009175354.1 hypothetical protein T265_10647 [Opisthorchis viverrini]KER20897.1 hypothetical protein T265_10646 [Opisthorchis viverrini]KER20898.1 hypothetical protein T265_10647 [Opisthorchis viverrini]
MEQTSLSDNYCVIVTALLRMHGGSLFAFFILTANPLQKPEECRGNTFAYYMYFLLLKFGD